MATEIDRENKEEVTNATTTTGTERTSSRNSAVAPMEAPLKAPNDEQAIARANATLDQLDQLDETIREELRGDDLSSGELGYELPAGFCLSIVVPVYNEERTINRVISSLFALPLPVEVIVVDDGSTDATCAMLTTLNQEFPELRVAFQETNQGKGAALRRGFSMATGSYIMVQDADLEYDPRDIPSLVEPLAKNEADVVYGSRFMEDHRKGSSMVHRLGNGLLTKASNYMTGWELTDMETCYKVMRRSLLNHIELEQDSFGFEVELTSKLAAMDARVVERPITYDARSWEEGKKIGVRDAFEALYCICRYR